LYNEVKSGIELAS